MSLNPGEVLEFIEEAMAQLKEAKEAVEEAKKTTPTPVRVMHRTVVGLYDKVRQRQRFDSADWDDLEEVLQALCQGRLCVDDKQTRIDEKLPSDAPDE